LIQSRRPTKIQNKTIFFLIGMGLICFIILLKLFQLQVLNHKYYTQIAQASQYGSSEIPAQRGEILIKDHHSGAEFPIATNTTLNLIFVDPTMVKSPEYITEKIAPLIFNIEEERAADEERRNNLARNLAPELSQEEINELLKPLRDGELEHNFRQNLTEKIGQKQRPQIILRTNLPEEKESQIKALNLTGVEIKDGTVYAYPPQINSPARTASALSPLVQIAESQLENILKGTNRYVVLKRKLDPNISEAINDLRKNDPEKMLLGLSMTEEYFRFYPEESLGANIVGYVNREGIGQYGIERTFNKGLSGTPGKIQTKRDSIGRQITVGESVLEPAINGDTIVLTIDRSVQLNIERILEEAVESHRADSGQIIIMNPKTGAITAMAHYPSFNPNEYGDVFRKKEIRLTPEEIRGLEETMNEGIYYFYVNKDIGDRYTVFKEQDSNGNIRYFRYENYFGPEVYHNKIISWPYEPGSVFKTIAMAAAIDDGTISSNTTFNDDGPIGVDFNVHTQKHDFYIRNALDRYLGLTNMKTVLAESLNTGMTFISKKMGAPLYYSYLKKFGFLDRTDIELDEESLGRIQHFDKWTESMLATATFGQGITVTMIQLANAYSAIANGGILMQPYIIEEIRHGDKTITQNEPRQIRRVISEDTASKIKAMLIYTMESEIAHKIWLNSHQIAGKTGTSQTYRYGRALTGSGTTIGSIAGFGPIHDPQFVIVVKLDKPRSSVWGSDTAGPTFKKVAEYLFNYYNIPPDK
jgi:stage V sporulation protein D (sporulation-specific penicillin-binding protein)